jgi:hypothetical protein
LEKNTEQNQADAEIKGVIKFTSFAKDKESKDDGITRFQIIGQIDSKGREALQCLNLQQIHANGAEQSMTKHQPKV